jgi:oxazoline/thiazoline dehydrogenase
MKEAHHLLLSLRRDSANLEELADGTFILSAPQTRIALEHAPQGALILTRALLTRKWLLGDLFALPAEQGEQVEPAQLFQFLMLLRSEGLLAYTVPVAGGDFSTLVPNSPTFRLQHDELDGKRKYNLSRFAFLRSVEGEMVLESPRAHAKLILHDRRATAIIHELAGGRTHSELCELFKDLPEVSVSLLLGLLQSATMLNPDTDPALRQWAFHDLLFHRRSRQGRHAEAYGKTERFRGEIPPCPALKPALSDGRVPLAIPDMVEVVKRDRTLEMAMATRRSVRCHAKEPITLASLSEFLYRTLRSEPTRDAEIRSYEHDFRPYPSGGACHELEFYLLVSACEGLSPGLYHYQPREHALYRLRAEDEPCESLLMDASRSTGNASRPQILIVFAARFQRVSWAYEGMAYALILKHVGVVFEAMYLVAASMGLAACALGGGNADTFAKATGLDEHVEGSVGEFLLGLPQK